jgi:HPt (histidine-containing phosphotransfer) domain-containing protein
MPEDLVNVDTVNELVAVEAESGIAFVAGLLEAFACDAREALERMRDCARCGDAERVAREAHRLKGSSGSVGAARLSGECQVIERNAREGRCEALEARIEHALRVLDASRQGIERLIPRPAGG